MDSLRLLFFVCLIPFSEILQAENSHYFEIGNNSVRGEYQGWTSIDSEHKRCELLSIRLIYFNI
jgi:hypothetical protein